MRSSVVKKFGKVMIVNHSCAGMLMPKIQKTHKCPCCCKDDLTALRSK